MRNASKAEQVSPNEKQTQFVLEWFTHHFFQCSTSPKRTSEVCEAVNKGGEKFIWNGS